jgi:hypothetical protein
MYGSQARDHNLQDRRLSNRPLTDETTQMRRAVVAYGTVGDDGAGLGRDLELLGGELEHRGEGRRLGHAEPAGNSKRLGRFRIGIGRGKHGPRGIRSEGGREGGAGTHTLKGSLGSDVRMILKDTFPPPPPAAAAVAMVCLRFEEKDCVFLKRTRLVPLVFSASFFSY